MQQLLILCPLPRFDNEELTPSIPTPSPRLQQRVVEPLAHCQLFLVNLISRMPLVEYPKDLNIQKQSVVRIANHLHSAQVLTIAYTRH